MGTFDYPFLKTLPRHISYARSRALLPALCGLRPSSWERAGHRASRYQPYKDRGRARVLLRQGSIEKCMPDAPRAIIESKPDRELKKAIRPEGLFYCRAVSAISGASPRFAA